MAVSETTLQSWIKPSSPTEDDKRDRTERMIREAIASSSELSAYSLKVYAKGSYKNNTNVRADSDVDIAVECTNLSYFSLVGNAAGKTREELGIGAPYRDFSFSDFKAAVARALVAKFGSSNVERGNKAIFVHQRSTSLDADVVPCVKYKSYVGPRSYREGIRIYPDDGNPTSVENFPRRNYDNGVAKNNRTGRHYKWIVRALKRLENQLVTEGLIAEVPSYLIECLVYTAPDDKFNRGSLSADMRAVLAHIFNGTRSDERCNDWTEVNQVKYLFRPSQKWTREQAHAFTSAAWNYMGFE